MKFGITKLAILVLMLGGCMRKSATPPLVATISATEIPQTTETFTIEPAADLPWWRTAVFYEIFVRSFYDSSGDGIGDFNGLTQKLDYLNDGDPDTHDDLGITAIWLMPIHPSPSYHGYDVVNYYAVNPEYGSMADFKDFLDQAHQRGIKVIIDLVLNHTSNQHPFFVDAKTSETSSFHDWYLWSSESKGAGWYPLIVGGKELSYYAYFCDCMPDLNYANPEVTAQMEQVVKFWLEKIGVDGFRIDAAKHLIENGDASIVNSPETHTWFKQFYSAYKSVAPQAYAVGEVANSDAKLTSTWANGELDQIFNFEMASGMLNSVNGEAASGVKSAVAFTQADNPDWNFGTFLTNHDQTRVMNVLGGKTDKAKTAAFMLLTHPGTPFIYYGEEIGMTGQKPDEDIRRPMQWNPEENAGFTTGAAWEEVHADTYLINVQDEQGDADLLLKTYQSLISLRQAHPALSTGAYSPLDTSNRGIYAFVRQTTQETLLVVVNLTGKDVSDYTIRGIIPGTPDGVYELKTLHGEAPGLDLTIQDGKLEDSTPAASLGAYQGYVFQLNHK